MNVISNQIKKLPKLLFLLVFFPTLFLSWSNPSNAQMAVLCTNCSDFITQLTQYSEQVLQYAKQVQQYELQIKQYEDQFKNSIRISNSVFDNALTTVRNIESIMNNASNIRYTMSNINWQFQQLYPNVYQRMNYLKTLQPQQALNDSFTRNQEAYDTARTALEAARAQSEDMSQDQYRMDRAGGSLIGANGRLDAIQAAGEYAQMTAQQLIKMRQLALVQIQMQSAIIANQTRENDLKRAALENWVEDRPASPRHDPVDSENF